jgi:hypothetical protein
VKGRIAHAVVIRKPNGASDCGPVGCDSVQFFKQIHTFRRKRLPAYIGLNCFAWGTGSGI